MGVKDEMKSKIAFAVFIAVFLTCAAFASPHAEAQAQTNTSFTPNDKFQIPATNGTISFGVSGNYSQATLVADKWVFTNLRLNNSGRLGALPTFEFSAQNSVVVIRQCRQNSTPSITLVSLIYNVTGPGGVQSFKFGVNLTGGSWYFVFNRDIYPTENHGWTRASDGAITVTGAAANVSVSYFSGDFGNPNSNYSNLPWWQQHSVAIATGASVAVAVVLAVIFTLRNRIKERQSTSE